MPTKRQLIDTILRELKRQGRGAKHFSYGPIQKDDDGFPDFNIDDWLQIGPLADAILSSYQEGGGQKGQAQASHVDPAGNPGRGKNETDQG